MDDVRVKDQKDKELLTASRLSAKIEISPLLQGKISISNVQFYGFDIRLYQEKKGGQPNFQFLIDAFSKKDGGPSDPNLRINSVLIRRGKLSWHRLDRPATPGRFNPDHIVLDKVSATLSLKQYTKDSLNLNVKKISFEEQSGLQLRQLGFRLTANEHEARLEDFTLEMPHSSLQLHTVTCRYEPFQDANGHRRYRNPVFQGSSRNIRLSPEDWYPFLPQLKKAEDFKELFPLHLEARFQGDSKQISADRLKVCSDGQDITLETNMTVSQLQNKDWLTLDARILNLQASSTSLRQLASWNPSAKSKLHPLLSSVGPLQADGHVSYNRRRIQCDLNLQAGPGSVSLTGSLTENDKVVASIHSRAFDFGILAQPKHPVGTASFDFYCKGNLRQGTYPALTFNGTVQQLDYKGYAYHDIIFNADYKDGGFDGKLSVNDPNVALTAEGKFNLRTCIPYITGKASVRRFNPHALNLTARYPGTMFQGELDVEFQGRDIEDMEGNLKVGPIRMVSAEEEYNVSPIQFQATRNAGQRLLLLDSDFLHVRMAGDFKLTTLIAHSRELMHDYLPSFIKKPHMKRDTSDEATLSVEVNHTEPIEKLTGIPLRIHQPGKLDGYLNSRTKEIRLNANLPALEYNGQRLDGIVLSAGTINDSLSCFLGFKKQVGKAPVDFNLSTRALQDQISAGLYWTNHTGKSYQGAITASTRFSRDEDQKLQTDIEFLPTRIIVNDSIWDVRASYVHAAPGTLSVNGFTIEQGDRHLILNGKVSNHPEDSLIAELKDINLEYIFNIINFHTVEFAGQATGRVYATKLMKSPEVDAYLHVQDFTFNQAYLGEMNVHGGWGKEKSAVFLNARIADPANRSMTRVDGDIRIGAPPKGGIDLTINTENIDLSFLNHYTANIFSGLNGRASGWVRVFGPFKGINLEGDMLVHEGGLKVSSTEVEYKLINDSVILRPDNIYFRNAIVYDRYGGPGTDGHYAKVNGVLRHTHLSRMSYDFDIEAHNILGYDVKDFGDEMFCGTAYATGKVGFYGRTGDLNINIDARPEAGTVFTYNLSSPATLADNQFITYKNPADSVKAKVQTSPQPTPSQPETDMRINFQLDLAPEATMKILMDPKAGDYIALNGHGNIRATYYNKGDFTMYGTYTIDDGIYKLSLQDVIRKDFILNPGGTIVFSGIPTEADLNLQAVYTVPSVSLNDLSARSTFSQNNVRVNCLMNLSGKAMSPQINFDFDIPNVNEDEKQMVRSLISTEEEKNMQVIYLLGIGRFYTYDYTNTEQSQSSVAMKSLLSSTLSSQLNQMLSNIIGTNSNWNIGTNLSTGDVGWSDMDVEGLLSGRLLNNRLLINGNFGYRDNNATSNGNFIGDFDLQWLLTRNGNVSLKAYSKTNDRYFTKSTLTTQGIGIAVKRDFGSWRDMFRLFVPKKWRKSRPLQPPQDPKTN